MTYARRCSGRGVVRVEKANGRAPWFEEVGEGATWTEAFEDARARLTRASAGGQGASRKEANSSRNILNAE
jgi:hypothetical protein